MAGSCILSQRLEKSSWILPWADYAGGPYYQLLLVKQSESLQHQLEEVPMALSITISGILMLQR